MEDDLKEKQKNNPTQGHSRREAIKRIGLLGLGGVLVSQFPPIVGAANYLNRNQLAVRVVPCYHSTVLNYYSSINYYSAGPPYNVYNSLNQYNSTAYYSCAQ